jgi:hypothetical protein
MWIGTSNRVHTPVDGRAPRLKFTNGPLIRFEPQ